MAFKIYTKTGDAGTTSLIGGTRVSKADLRIEAYGTLDELNAYIGLCRDKLGETVTMKGEALAIAQDVLFIAGALLARDGAKNVKMQLPEMRESFILDLEKEIDAMEAELPALKQFILPGGHPLVSHLHIARCVCRRGERACVRLQEYVPVEESIIKYLNRLSDFLFVLARYCGQQLHAPEIVWNPSV